MPSSKNRNRARRLRLLAEHPFCFYCGLGFPPDGLAVPPAGSPGWEKEYVWSEPTLEHLVPKSKGGTSARGNCVLAHFWCNTVAADRPVAEKHALRARLRAAVALLFGVGAA